ncbi:hypothetical protein Ddye_001365 [Dipteronia dyeriana]|uniref:DUF7026 domain-containing protein n=1 Tax=Dipteronia dyeriana TaxID=168575 RepID=A0AAD9XN99_9ROSI|nr:hypothetical protein Ddye_001365 [Dipteronia dyeriana]
MALRINLLFPNTLPQSLKFQSNPNRPRTLTLCTSSNSSSDSELASDLAKINTHLLHKQEAMKKSKELLFTDLCQFLDLKEEQVKNKWSKIDEDEKWDLVKGFVSEWGVNFHPLSPRSIKELIEEYLLEEEKQPSPFSTSTTASLLFSGLKRLMS